jgi:GAF domain-containing protein
MARDIFGAPISLVTLIDSNMQWLKARCGLDIKSTPREVAFCNHTIAADDILIVPDAQQDEGFACNPLVTGAPFIRFYAEAPLILSSWKPTT